MKIVSVGILGGVLVRAFGAPSRTVALIAIALSLAVVILPKKKRLRNG
jgi:hypothetical protein